VLAVEPYLDQYYRDYVIGGPGAFMVVANDFESFGEAILKKMIVEIAANDRRLGSRAAPLPGARGALRHSFSCLRIKQPKLRRSRTWGGRGRARLFSLPPNEGVGAPSRRGRRKETAPVGAPRGFSRFRVPRCPDQGRPVVAGGVSPGVRPGVQLRTTPA